MKSVKNQLHQFRKAGLLCTQMIFRPPSRDTVCQGLDAHAAYACTRIFSGMHIQATKSQHSAAHQEDKNRVYPDLGCLEQIQSLSPEHLKL